jgi:5-aminopentanamidase
MLRLALLHLAPSLGDLEANRRLLENSTRVAGDLGADWVLSGELVVSGYEFETLIGTAWIESQPDEWLKRYAALVRSLRVCAFVHHPERDEETEQLFSTMFAIDRAGSIVGRHRKLRPTPGSESWAMRGEMSGPVAIDGVRVGMLICADAYPAEPARALVDAGARILVSSAAWHPGDWGPAGEWEARSAETGVPVVVCNRTGADLHASFKLAESAVADHGVRLASLCAARSTVFLVDLHLGDKASAERIVQVDL